MAKIIILAGTAVWKVQLMMPEIIKLREKRKRNFLGTLLLSQGVPMISHGDEYGRTQNGNNNAYCQDNEIAWMDWNWNENQKNLFEFTKRIITIRNEHSDSASAAVL